MRLPIALIAALAASPALAEAPAPADAPIAAAGGPDLTAAQVDAWIRSSPAADARAGAITEPDAPPVDRAPHGQVAVGVGSHGYRSFAAQADMPVGQDGRLSVFVSQSRGGWAGAYPPLRMAPLSSVSDRQRCDLEGMSPARPLDVIGGPNGRCVSRLADW